jgi:hypothetical protein
MNSKLSEYPRGPAPKGLAVFPQCEVTRLAQRETSSPQIDALRKVHCLDALAGQEHGRTIALADTSLPAGPSGGLCGPLR